MKYLALGLIALAACIAMTWAAEEAASSDLNTAEQFYGGRGYGGYGGYGGYNRGYGGYGGGYNRGYGRGYGGYGGYGNLGYGGLGLNYYG